LNLLDYAFLTTQKGLILGPISWLMGKILNGIYKFFSLFTQDVNGIGMANIALCIIVFTIITKMLMIPLTIKQQKSSKLSSQMSPELSAISEKYRGKTDEASRMKMQRETQAVYEKYGTNPMAGCLMLLITFPIVIALYRVIYAIPGYIDDVKEMYELAADAIRTIPDYADHLAKFVKEMGISGVSADAEYYIIDVLAKCNKDAWGELIDIEAFAGIANQLENYSKPILEVHQFVGGLNILNKPVENGNYFTIGILIPIMAAGFQFLQSKLSMAKMSQGNANDPAMSSMKTMNLFFPIMSGFICFMMPIGAGIYWIVSSIVQIIQQFFINRYMDKISVEELIAINQEKRAKKLKKMGIDTGSRMAEVAKTSTKSIEVETKVKSTADYAKMVNKNDINEVTSVEDTNEKEESTTISPSGGSISDYANILKNRSGK